MRTIFIFIISLFVVSSSIWAANTSNFTMKIRSVAASQTNLNISGIGAIDHSTQLLINNIPIQIQISDESGAFTFSLIDTSIGQQRLTIVQPLNDSQAGIPAQHSFTLNIPESATTEITEIVLPPKLIIQQTGAVEPTLQVEIHTSPGALVEFRTERQGYAQTYASGTADAFGQHQVSFSRNDLEFGSYKTSFRVQQNGLYSEWSSPWTFNVAASGLFYQGEYIDCGPADLNCDQSVTIHDFSIAAFWYQETLPDEIVTLEKQRLTGDGTVDLKDMSLLAYYYTQRPL